MSPDTYLQHVFAALLAQEISHSRTAIGSGGARSHAVLGAEKLLGAAMRASLRMTELVDGGEVARLLREFDRDSTPLTVSRVLGADVPFLAACIAQSLQRHRSQERMTSSAIERLRAQVVRVMTSRTDLCALVEAYAYMEQDSFRATVEAWLCREIEAELSVDPRTGGAGA